MDKATLTHIAKLARLAIDPAVSEKTTADINNVLKLVDQLQAIDTTGIDPLAHPHETGLLLREDRAHSQIDREILQALAANTNQHLYLVPKVLQSESQ